MQSPEQLNEATLPAPDRKPEPITNPTFTGTPQPIRELAGRPDFPQCALGLYVDIQGFSGVVVEIVRESIKVRPPEGITQRFNANRLRTLYAPPVHIEPMPSRPAEQPKPAVARESEREPAPPKPEAPPRVFIENPDFSQPVQPISDFASQPDFPKNIYGRHVDILGYIGVVVEIVKGSLRVQSDTGITRSYNAAMMKKLHGNAGPSRSSNPPAS